MHVPFVNLRAQYDQVGAGVFAGIAELIKECRCIQGDALEQFEGEFAAYIGAKYAVGVGCGLDALTIALMCLDIGPGDEAIVPVNTFIATALAVSRVGATPVFIDCDATYNMDIGQLGSKITTRTRAVIPVHLTGKPVDMDGLYNVLEGREISVIEDAAQAHGAWAGDKVCGSIGEAGCFSFYPSKNLGCCGDGGMLVTSISSIAERARAYRNYGETSKYFSVVKGVNSCLDPIQAMILSAKLPYLSEWNGWRYRLAFEYREMLDGVVRFAEDGPHESVYHLMPIFTERRDELREYLKECGVETGIHYPTLIHQQPAYREHAHESYPVAERMSSEELSLPMSTHTSLEQADYVCECIKEFFQ